MEGIVQKLLGRPIKADCWVWAKRATQHRPRAVRKRGEAGLAGSLGLPKVLWLATDSATGHPHTHTGREHVEDKAAEKPSRGSELNVAL